MIEYQNSGRAASESRGEPIIRELDEAEELWPDPPTVEVSDLAPPPPPAKVRALKREAYKNNPLECGFEGICECTPNEDYRGRGEGQRTECFCCCLPGERIICQGLEWSLSTHGIYSPRWCHFVKREDVEHLTPEGRRMLIQHFAGKGGVDWRELDELVAIGLRVWR